MTNKERSSNYRREMEMLVGALEQMCQQNDRATAVIAAYLNRAINNIRKEGWEQLDTRILAMRKTYDIQLKIDFEDASRHKIAMHLMRKAARTILTQANMIADGREPQIALTTDDFFEGGTIESLQELSEIQEVGDGIVPQDQE